MKTLNLVKYTALRCRCNGQTRAHVLLQLVELHYVNNHGIRCPTIYYWGHCVWEVFLLLLSSQMHTDYKKLVFEVVLICSDVSFELRYCAVDEHHHTCCFRWRERRWRQRRSSLVPLQTRTAWIAAWTGWKRTTWSCRDRCSSCSSSWRKRSRSTRRGENMIMTPVRVIIFFFRDGCSSCSNSWHGLNSSTCRYENFCRSRCKFTPLSLASLGILVL